MLIAGTVLVLSLLLAIFPSWFPAVWGVGFPRAADNREYRIGALSASSAICALSLNCFNPVGGES